MQPLLETAARVAKDMRDHPNLMKLTELGYIPTEIYGKRDEIWYMTNDDGSFHFYYREKDCVASSRQLSLFPSQNTRNALREPSTCEFDTIQNRSYIEMLTIGDGI